MKIFPKILIFMAILGFLISLSVVVNRVRIESSFKEVDLAIDYESVRLLARQSGLDAVTLFKRFKAEGITSVIVPEDTLSSLQDEERLSWFTSGQLKQWAQLDLFSGYSLHPKLKRILLNHNKSYILTDDHSLCEYLYKILNHKISGSIKKNRKGSLSVIEIEGADKVLSEIGLGFFKKKIEELSRLDLNIILFPNNLGQPKAPAIDCLFEVAKIPGVNRIVFEDEVLGYPEDLTTTLQRLENRRLKLLLLEFSRPKGIQFLTSGIRQDYIIRVHRISKEEMQSLDQKTVITRFLRAARERNIRCLWLLLFLDGRRDLLDLNLKYIKELKERLKYAGFRIGTKNTLPRIKINNFLLFLMSLGVISSLLILVNRIIPSSFAWSSFILIIGVCISLFGLLNRTFLQQFWAIIAGLIFPTLAMFNLEVSLEKRPYSPTLGWCIKNILITSGISLTGALFIIGLLSETSYLLKINEIRGVKMMLFLPIFAVGIFTYLKEHSIGELLINPIRTIHLIKIGILFGLLILLFFYSGNYGFPRLAQEDWIRAILERLFFARPRFKEFLIGYPALYLAIFLRSQGYRSIFLLTLATLSQVSLINTYLHLHTPLLFQLVRSINGFWLGILIGMAVGYMGWILTRIKGVLAQ